ncbi:hypothetical protein AB0I00_35570 [Streptomyces sp. NPDC050803]|uniref:hypothetical protein n=1 Tax=unclassified Streptomyces TaxID=2593676 RepID=UPI00342F7DD6
MDVYEDPATWTPEPVRARWKLALRFVGTVLFVPLFCVFWLAAAVVLSVVDTVAEAVGATGTGRAFARISHLPSWCVSWPELRYEGDTAYYKARVERVVGDWTAKALAPRNLKKYRRLVECEIPLRDYRGVGGWYVAEVAVAQGWELRPTDVRNEVRLWWSAASHVDSVNTA